jgi:hypothetical protein
VEHHGFSMIKKMLPLKSIEDLDALEVALEESSFVRKFVSVHFPFLELLVIVILLQKLYIASLKPAGPIINKFLSTLFKEYLFDDDFLVEKLNWSDRLDKRPLKSTRLMEDVLRRKYIIVFFWHLFIPKFIQCISAFWNDAGGRNFDSVASHAAKLAHDRVRARKNENKDNKKKKEMKKKQQKKLMVQEIDKEDECEEYEDYEELEQYGDEQENWGIQGTCFSLNWIDLKFWEL